MFRTFINYEYSQHLKMQSNPQPPRKNKLNVRLAGKSETSPVIVGTFHPRGRHGVRIPGSGHKECLLRLCREGSVKSGDQPRRRGPCRFSRPRSANQLQRGCRTKGRLGAGATVLTRRHVPFYTARFLGGECGTVQK